MAFPPSTVGEAQRNSPNDSQGVSFLQEHNASFVRASLV